MPDEPEVDQTRSDPPVPGQEEDDPRFEEIQEEVDEIRGRLGVVVDVTDTGAVRVDVGDPGVALPQNPDPDVRPVMPPEDRDDSGPQ